jgi:3,4-dihydroxy 2-butanone 4-phosphate synthase
LDTIEQAIHALKEGSFVLIHDDKSRENEVDMVVAAEHIKPHHIA